RRHSPARVVIHAPRASGSVTGSFSFFLGRKSQVAIHGRELPRCFVFTAIQKRQFKTGRPFAVRSLLAFVRNGDVSIRAILSADLELNRDTDASSAGFVVSYCGGGWHGSLCIAE